MQILDFFLLYLFRLFPLLFGVHLLAATVSPTVRQHIREHPLFNVGWFMVSVAVAIVAIITARAGH